MTKPTIGDIWFNNVFNEHYLILDEEKFSNQTKYELLVLDSGQYKNLTNHHIIRFCNKVA